MTDRHVLVFDSSDEPAAVGPDTDIHVFVDEAAAREAFPDAMHRSDVDQGNLLNEPVIWPEADR